MTGRAGSSPASGTIFLSMTYSNNALTPCNFSKGFPDWKASDRVHSMKEQNHFYEKVNQISPISPSEWDSIEPSLELKSFSKGECLLSAGEKAQRIGFLLKGAVRLFYLTHDEREFNQTFKFQGDLVAGYASLLTGEPMSFSIEALEDGEYLTFPFAKLTSLYEQNSCWERLGRKVAEQHFLNKESREASFLLLDAKSRYLKFIKGRPGVEKRIPQYHIASFLGVTASAFNRLFKELP